MNKSIAFQQVLRRLDVYGMEGGKHANVIEFLRSTPEVEAAWNDLAVRWTNSPAKPEQVRAAIRGRREVMISTIRQYHSAMTREEKLLIRPYLRAMFKAWATIEHALVLREIEEML